jgi:hypothetical protein
MTGVAPDQPDFMSRLKCEMKSRNQKSDRLRGQDSGDRLAFEIRMGFHQLVAACANMTGVAPDQPDFMSDLKCEIKPAR